MATRRRPASTAKTRPARQKPVKKKKATPARQKKNAPRRRANDPASVVFKEENSDGVTAKELLRRTAARAAISPAFIAALARDFERHGADAIAKTRELAPATYVRLSAALLPMDAAPTAALPDRPTAEAAALPAPEEVEAVAQRIAELREIIARELAASEGASFQSAPASGGSGETPGEDAP
jgi:hypothetical protein